MRGAPHITLADRVLWHAPLPAGKVTLKLLFAPRDVWCGAYWDVRYDDLWQAERMLYIWVCLVPMLPLRIGLPWPYGRDRRERWND